MWIEFSWRNVALTVAAAVLIASGIIIFTGNSHEPSQVMTGYVPLVTQTPIPLSFRIADSVGPGSATHSSLLVMVQGMQDRRLVIWPLSGTGELMEVDRHIAYGPLLPDPTQKRVFYSTDHTAMVLDIEARRAIIVGELPDGGEVVSAQWSPDGRALMYVVYGTEHRIAYYSQADGLVLAQEVRRVPRGLALDVGWLPDGRPAVIHVGMGPVGGLEPRYDAFDPTTGDVVPLPSGVEIIQPHTPWQSPDGTMQVYPMADWQGADYRSGCRQASLGLADDEWLGVVLVSPSPLASVAFTIPNVYLDDPVWLRSGQIIMRGIADDSCPSAGTGLYVARLGERPRPLAIMTDVFYALDASKKLRWGPAYAVSPDQTLVAWAENDNDQRRSTIYLTPLDQTATSDISILYQVEAQFGATPWFYFDNSLAILDFIWLP